MPLQLYKIASIELSSASSTITFSSIPQGYTDLKIVVSARSDYSGPWTNCSISINGSTSNFSSNFIYAGGSGSAASTTRTDNLNVTFANAATSTSNTFSNEELYFPNYTNNNYKSFSVDKVAETNAVEAYIHMNSVLWSSNAAITSIAFTSQNNNFAPNTTATLYGIL
jgi:hypothetical protein